MANIKGLNIRVMLSLIAMVNNDFIVTNAALDVQKNAGSLSREMQWLEQSFNFQFFVWKKRKPEHIKKKITGLTKEGELFYKSVKWFISSIDAELL